MRKLLLMLMGMLLAATACASSPTETGAGSQPDPTATTAAAQPTAGPTPLNVPTAGPTSQSQVTPTAVPSVQPTSSVPTSTPQPTATARPIPTAAPTSTPLPTATPRPPAPTATAVPPTPVPPTPTPTPTPSSLPILRVDCTVSDRDIVVNEVITLRATHTPANLPVEFAFNHGDGTVDRTAESRAFYRSPGRYNVTLLWQYRGGKGSKSCGTVNVHPIAVPTPTPTPPAVQIGCRISPQRTVQVNETLTFTAFQNPTNVPVSYIFDHGDGTLDETSQSFAYYAAPGFYDVRLRWAYSNRSGTTFCGTVIVEPAFNAGDYTGRSLAAAESVAWSRGLVTRVVRIDDEWYPGTTDYRLDRVNFEIDAQIVTAAYLG